MKVELVLNIEENNESAVLEKVLEITKHINQIGLKIDKLLMLEKYDISYLMSRLNNGVLNSLGASQSGSNGGRGCINDKIITTNPNLSIPCR